MGWFYRLPLWLAAHTIPSSRFSGSDAGVTPSDNTEMLRAFSLDPLVIKKSRVDTVYGIAQVMDRAQKLSGEVHTPALLLYGAHDEVIPKEPVLQALRKMSGQRSAYYPEGYHMLTRDLQAVVVHKDIAAWMLHPSEEMPSGMDSEVGVRLKEDIAAEGLF